MLTLIDSICVAGDRARQNDDAFGVREDAAFVLDGATDLHDEPIMPARSDAAWIARFTAARLMALSMDDLQATVAEASAAAGEAFAARLAGAIVERWRMPTAALLIARETPEGVLVADLGDSRCFLLDAAGHSFAIGGPERARIDETALAAQHQAQAPAGQPAYKSPEALAVLRAARDMHNIDGGYAVFGVEPVCAQGLRIAAAPMTRPAYLLLATDGFAALSDAYHLFSPASLVKTARERGLAYLVEALRGFEHADAAGARHPRWKKSDDATAVLLRLE